MTESSVYLGIMARAFRRVDIEVPNNGAYITVFQRPGEKPKLDVTFFEGDQSVATAIARQRALTKAIKLAKKWRDEG